MSWLIRYVGKVLKLRRKRPRRRKIAISRRVRYVIKRVDLAWSKDFVVEVFDLELVIVDRA